MGARVRSSSIAGTTLVVVVLFLSAALLAASLQAAPVVAHQEGDHAQGEHQAVEDEGHGPTWGEMIARWINLSMLLAILWWLLVMPPQFIIETFDFPGLRVVLAERRAAIVAARGLAAQQEVEAQQQQIDSQARLAGVEEEAVALLESAREDAEREQARLAELAAAEAQRVRESATRDLRSETQRARRDLQIYVADLSVKIARSLLEEHLSDADQDRLVREYVDQLAGSVA